MVRLLLTYRIICLSAKSFASCYVPASLTDSATIGFAETTYTVAEGNSQEVCVSVQSGTLGRDVEVTLESTDGTATSTGESGDLNVHR